MNLKTTLQTLRRIERLLDGWQSSDDISAIERDLACDLLRRAYDDIFFLDKNAATAPEVPLAENTSADRMNEKAVGEAAGTPVDATVDAAAAAGDALIADAVSPVGLVGLAPSGEPAEETPEESPENAAAVAESAAESASVEMPAEVSAEEDASVVTPVEESVPVEKSVEEPASAEAPVDESASVEKSVSVEKSIEEPASGEMPVEDPASVEESVPVEKSVGEPAFAEAPVDGSASVEESVSVEKSVEEPASGEMPVEEPASVEESVSVERSVDEPASVEAPVGDVTEEEIPVEEFEVFGEAEDAGDTVQESGNAVEEPDDTVSPAEDVATSILETSADIVIDPVFEVFTDEDEDAEEPEDAEAAEAVNLVDAVNVMEAVEAVGPAEDTEIAEEMEIVEETEAKETAIEQPVAAPAAIRSAAATVEPAAEPGPESVLTPAGTSVEETPADAAASNAETLEEMAARFKNALGRRRKSRRAFLSLYDDDETARRGARNDQLELSDWGLQPSDPSAKLRHTRELFGLPVDDLDTASEPAPRPAAAAVANADAADDEMKMEIIDFLDDDILAQSDRTAKPAAESPVKPAIKPTPEPTAAPTEPTPRQTVAPAREEQDDADDDLPFDEAVMALEDLDDASSAVPSLEPLGSPERSESPESSESPDAVSFDSIEIVEISDGDEEVFGIEEDEIQHADRTEAAGEPAKSEPVAPAVFATEPATPAASATEPTAVRGLYGHEEKQELPASTTVLGEVMGHDVPTVGDTLGHRPDVAGWPDVSDDLNRAISVGDRFVLLRDLFDGDQALCDRTLKRLSTFDDLDDCMIWITENFAWNANSEGAKLIMGLLERKLG